MLTPHEIKLVALSLMAACAMTALQGAHAGAPAPFSPTIAGASLSARPIPDPPPTQPQPGGGDVASLMPAGMFDDPSGWMLWPIGKAALYGGRALLAPQS